MSSEVEQTSQPPACPFLTFPLLPCPPALTHSHFPLKLFSGTCRDWVPEFWSCKLRLCLLSVGVGHVGGFALTCFFRLSSLLHLYPTGQVGGEL